MKSIVTILRQRTSGGWKFIVKDLSTIIGIISSKKKSEGNKKALDLAAEYRDGMFRDGGCAPAATYLCRCGRATSDLYDNGGGAKVCLTCAKREQSRTETQDEQEKFDELVKATEELGCSQAQVSHIGAGCQQGVSMWRVLGDRPWHRD